MDKEDSVKNIKALKSLGAVRDEFDIIELSKKVKRQGDVLILSKELKIKPRILKSAVYEGRILSLLPDISKSKAGILASLRTDRDVRKFAKIHDLGSISARELIKKVRLWNKNLEENPFNLLTRKEHEVILGTLMGDASIRKRERNSCLRFSHSIKQKEYCKIKKEILESFNLSEFREYKRLKKNGILHTLDFATKTHSVFNYYRNLFYSEGKKVITQEILNQLTSRSLAFWICDDGSYCKSGKYIILCTNSFSFEEHQLIQRFFLKKFGLNPTIGFRDNKYHYLRFSKSDTEKLVNIVKPFIPPFMNYKIGVTKNV